MAKQQCLVGADLQTPTFELRATGASASQFPGAIGFVSQINRRPASLGVFRLWDQARALRAASFDPVMLSSFAACVAARPDRRRFRSMNSTPAHSKAR